MYKRRIKVFMVLIASAFVVVGLRLGYLQILRGDQFRRQAAESLESGELLPARRGRIVDRNGEILALDRPCFDLCLDYRFLTEDPRWTGRQARRIARSDDLSPAEARQRYRRVRDGTWALAEQLARERDQDLSQRVETIRARVERMRASLGMDIQEQHISHPVITGLSEAQAVWAKTRLGETVGASVRPSHDRWYPHGQFACHVVGTTGGVTVEEQKRLNLTADDQPDPIRRRMSNYLAWDKIGKTGVEKLAEGILRGRRGYRRLSRGTEVVREVPAEAGRDVHLTIDIALQRMLTERLQAQGHHGAIVVLDVDAGQVLALVSTPTYDLNRYQQEASDLYQDRSFPLLNRAVYRAYPPGSTVKPIAALAALGSGEFTTDTEVYCRGYFRKPGKERCWKRSGHGHLDVVGALAGSCNVYFYTVGDRLGREELLYWFSNFGFGAKPGTGLPEERAGSLPTTEFLRRRYDRGAVPADAWFLCIGQAAITATPLQVANAIATVARGGEFLSPMLLLDAGPKQVRRVMPLREDHAAAVREGMWRVVNAEGGTAYRHFRDRPAKASLCGKSGTAQTNRDEDMAWFVGFAPYDDPQIAFAVVLEYVFGGGGRMAGPIARDVVDACVDLGHIRSAAGGER
jgi:penicillin-binding protein 2